MEKINRVFKDECPKCGYYTIQLRSDKCHWCPKCSVKKIKRPPLNPNTTIEDIQKLGFVLMTKTKIVY